MEAVLVMPTLNLAKAAKVCELAQETAGVPLAVVLVKDFKKRGGVKPSNAAFEAALQFGSEYIVYLNDDAQPTQRGWLKRMIEVLESDASYGVVAPSGRCGTKPQKKGQPGAPRGHEVVRHLAWFCAVVRRGALLEVGLFDEEFVHYGDESDWEMRAARKGWKSVWVRDIYFDHEREGSEPHPKWAERDGELFKRKWERRAQ